MIFSLFKERSSRKAAVASAYGTIVAAARRPKFYAEWGVPDTVEGRFELLALHMFLAVEAMAGHDLAQALTDEFFRDLDRSIREMGASDVSVPKKVRRMAEAYFGRAAAYSLALQAEDLAALETAIRRNVYANGEGDAAALSRYVMRQSAAPSAGGPQFLEP